MPRSMNDPMMKGEIVAPYQGESIRARRQTESCKEGRVKESKEGGRQGKGRDVVRGLTIPKKEYTRLMIGPLSC
jgi:hypothetical protein